ncbi:MAG TPA: hypothetical protein PKA06_04905, partial [Gemmatales bacterium]|nr:hypothetical protein [Gemmatales bacterium]
MKPHDQLVSTPPDKSAHLNTRNPPGNPAIILLDTSEPTRQILQSEYPKDKPLNSSTETWAQPDFKDAMAPRNEGNTTQVNLDQVIQSTMLADPNIRAGFELINQA